MLRTTLYYPSRKKTLFIREGRILFLMFIYLGGKLEHETQNFDFLVCSHFRPVDGWDGFRPRWFCLRAGPFLPEG